MKWKDSDGTDFEQPPIGTHVARCIKLIDIGTQQGEYQGKATFRRQVIIGWELPNELMREGDHAGKPFTVSKFYTASLGEKANLRADLKNWRGRDFTDEELAGFEAKNILGKPCMLSITLNDKGKARVTGVMALPKGTPVPDQINETLFFSLEPSDFKPEVFEALSEGYKKMIRVSPEYIKMIRVSPEYMELTKPGHAKPKTDGGISDMDDDIPFLFNMNTLCDTVGQPLSLWRAKYGKGLSVLRANQTDF